MYRLLFITLLLVCAAGCDSLLDTEAFNVQTLDSQLANPEGAVPFVNSIYGPLAGLYNGAMPSLTESGTDDAWPFAQNLEGMKERDINASQGQLGNIWTPSFTAIARANYYLNREGDIDFSGREELGDQLRGEALFLRALYYFNLVRIFGDVPIYDESNPIDEVTEAQQPRDSVSDVYAFIKGDLERAIALLPDDYRNNGLGQERGRATSGAARTLLGKVHLTLEEWQQVLSVTDPISGYRLESDYIDNFYGLLLDTSGENEGEAIFEAQYSELGAGPKSGNLRVIFVPRGVRNGQNQIIPTDDRYLDGTSGADGPNALVQAIEEGDARRDVLLSTYDRSNPITNSFPERDENGDVVRDSNGDVVLARELFVYKWWSDIGNNETAWNIPIFRYAEVLLMRAEALIELGQVGEALGLINEVRARAGLAPLEGLDQAAARAAVRQERRIEFAYENKRLFDLNRWGILVQEVERQGVTIDRGKVTQHPITGRDQVLYPIPLEELQRNPNASQNQGY